MNISKTIYLVRHGTTDYNEIDLLQGRIDNPLNKLGIREAELLAEKLKDKKIDIIFHSPLKRAKQTAEILNKPHKVEQKTIECFTEIDIGDWEGLDYSNVVKENLTFYQKWMSDPSVSIPGGESFLQVFDRVKPGVDEVLSSSFENIILVGHASVNRGILGNMLMIDPAAARLFRMRNAAYSKLLVYRNPKHHYIIVESWNNISHLEDLE